MVVNQSNIFLLFLFSIALHNIEEALWLPQWSKNAMKFHKQVEKNEFHFAVLVITLIAYLCTSLFIFFPNVLLLKYFYFGFVGAMIINTIFPHLIATIFLKKYSPGLITGVSLQIPVDCLIIVNSINNGIINFYILLLSIIIVGVFLLSIIPILFRMGRKFLYYI
ncbi:HXXEE domain-containing protein [Clostridium arbusti]|uniref:HXXEE domain-containing protein n=1 Tax=Clostridium arbusti TaxID=1137848 RepID=UPI0003045E51|nr:HXXEE domain-containing protein [Clostridium arbusti]